MYLAEPEQEFEVGAPRIFATTNWGVVLAAGQASSELSQDALETLCSAYWYPIYVYVRRKGHGPHDAKDLTQEFFTQLIEKQQLRLADRNKGRFRSFLLSALRYFLAREWSRAHRQKRGGRYHFISLDWETPDGDYQFEPADDDTPEKQFERHWALTVLKRAMNRLERECAAGKKGNLFRELKELLSGERDGVTCATVGGRLSMTESAVRVALHRLRQRYGELLRAEVAQTVSADEEVEEELRYLLKVLAE